MRRYAECRDSGLPWLGNVPAHWHTMMVKRVSRVIYGDSLADEARRMGNVPVYGSNGIVGYHDTAITSAPCIIIGRKGSFGKVNFSYEPCFPIDTTFFIDRSATKSNLRWLYYVLLTLQLDTVSQDSAVPGLPREQIHNHYIAVPPTDEQGAIVAFLDGRLAEIDRFIANKERLIALLKEQKAAIINRAVTRGLDAGAPMRPSGIEWLGEIPAHWEVTSLKYSIQDGLVNGVFKKKEYFGSGTPLVNVFDVYQDDFQIDTQGLERVQVEEHEQERYAVTFGDIFFVRSSLKLEGVGRAAMIADIPEPVVFECHLVRARPDQRKVLPLYLIHYLNCHVARETLIAAAKTVTMSTVDQQQIASSKVVVPPLDEQRQILSFVEKEGERIDAAVSKAEREIELIKEYRTALIADAVTGKIDVRAAVAERVEEEVAV